MKLSYRFIFPLFFLFNIGLAQERALDPMVLADSLLHLVLEQEGLFTLYGGLKPISTVQHFSYEIDSITGEYLTGQTVQKDLIRLSQSLKILSNDSIGYTVIPFKEVHGNKKYFELLVYHKAAVNELLSQKSSFFLKRGLIPGDGIEKVLALYEFEEKFDRFKAYGYLFGYPDHAVDFFVQAARIQDQGGDFVAREFYQIPVSNGKEGRFVYAVPKGYGSEEVDERLKGKAEVLLNRFKKDWEEYPQEHKTSALANLNFLYFLSTRTRSGSQKPD